MRAGAYVSIEFSYVITWRGGALCHGGVHIVGVSGVLQFLIRLCARVPRLSAGYAVPFLTHLIPYLVRSGREVHVMRNGRLLEGEQSHDLRSCLQALQFARSLHMAVYPKEGKATALALLYIKQEFKMGLCGEAVR